MYFNLNFPLNLLQKREDIIDLSPCFNRSHLFGEVFVDVNHMTGNGYCAHEKALFHLLKRNGYFESNNNLLKSENAEKIYRNVSVQEIDEFDKEIDEFVDKVLPYKLVSGAIVMSCNPFMLGHRYLIENVAKEVDCLFVSVVEE